MDPMKQLQQIKKYELKHLKKLSKEAQKNKKHAEKEKLDKQIDSLEQFIHRFRPANMEPKQINGIVINYKLYEKFMKKLKGFQVTEQVTDEKLIVKYQKGPNKGELKLLDIAGHFPEGSTFPKGELYYVIAI